MIGNTLILKIPKTPTQTVKHCRVSRKTITEECPTSVVWATI
jgi:hypothetical protein